ncbi:MAG: HepT-like ribonuclease domain-containing protein, partial [Thermodesulfobacteriota bacterium]
DFAFSACPGPRSGVTPAYVIPGQYRNDRGDDSKHKSYEYKLISQDMYQGLKPFFDFRNSLIHWYWSVDDSRLISNLSRGRGDFDRFVEEIDEYLWGR